MKEIFELEEKKTRYLEYIREHISNVRLIWRYTKDKIEDLKIITDSERKIIDRLISHHDNTKYFDIEFEGYRAYFYPTKEEKGSNFTKIEFENAWNHHQKNNPHHWNYWVLINGRNDVNAIPIPIQYIVEMLCDWSAMSIKFGDKPSIYFSKNKNDMILHEETIEKIEALIYVFDEIVTNIIGRKND